ncbi:Copper resistance protein CRF1, partial [Leucoagaricus sp. SymC.cos]
FIDSKKYACETCIKGHRSSACKHTDRPLFEIKKKGRPVTQCEHCRELRKTKQVHVKCICEVKNDPHSGAKVVKGVSIHLFARDERTKASESAAFPNGLPEGLAMEASVAHPEPITNDGPIADPSYFVAGCCCHLGEICGCWTPRKSAPRSRRKTESSASAPRLTTALTPPPAAAALPVLDAPVEVAAAAAAAAATPRAASHILARISELRPVLPRPSVHHDPSSGLAHGHPNRHHHENAFFSPYGRAYDINHPHHPHTAADDSPTTNNPHRLTLTGPATSKPQIFDRAAANSIATTSVSPSPPATATAPPPPSAITFPSPCGCGDGCSCPGCFHHNKTPFAPSPTAYPNCSNPATCNACLDCTILSLPPDTALSIPESQQAEVIDEWIRTISSSNNNIAEAGVTGQLAGWDNLAQLTAGRRQCATCTSFFCTCEKGATQREANCCDKPRASPPLSADMGTSMMVSEQQGYDGSAAGFFDYTMLGMQPSNDASFLDTSGIEAFRSRSPSISPQSSQEFPPQSQFSIFPYNALPAPQQSMYINGRGFYSDPYLSLSSNMTGMNDNERGMDNTGFGMIDTPFLHLPPLSSNLGYQPSGTYAVSNPDSDTSSFDSSVDDFVAPPPPPPPPQPFTTSKQQKQNQQHHALSVSSVSFEDVRTLY